MVIYNENKLSTNLYNPTDFEVKNLMHYLGTFEEFPPVLSTFASEGKTPALYDKVEVLSNLLKRQKYGYFGSSPFGLFTMVSCVEALPFALEDQIYNLVVENEFKSNRENRL
jgi:hypothetical protein